MSPPFYEETGTINPSLKQTLLDPETYDTHSDINALLENENYAWSKEDIHRLQEDLEKQVTKQLFYYTLLEYFVMDNENDWGDAGEQQVKTSFCHNLLNIPPDQHISHTQFHQFMTEISQHILKHNIQSLSLEEAKEKMKDYAITLLDHSFPAHKTDQITKLLQFVGSNLFLQGGYHGESLQFIMGTGKKYIRNEYTIIQFHQENIRTPNTIIAMAAAISNKTIFIRMEALLAIFTQKWVNGFGSKPSSHHSDYVHVAEHIKSKTLSSYHIKNVSELKALQDTFLNDMSDIIINHELGHGIIQHHILPHEANAIGEASRVFGENILTALLEFFADFAPEKDGISGPIHHLISLSQSDPHRATRMYYMYLSDTWFFNTEDTYMYLYSDLMAFVLIHHINPDLSIDFEGLEKAIHPTQSSGSVFQTLLTHYHHTVNEILNTVHETLPDLTKPKETDPYDDQAEFWNTTFIHLKEETDAKNTLTPVLKQAEKTIIQNLRKLYFKEEASKITDYRQKLAQTLSDLNLH
ncbi:MAG: hypothetical protein HRT90_01800 [Candidatus Margulisbacteria bacterium]|nr:hypothetical protein [Candidatus Margulisiibacteriota bacterium]